MARFAIYYVPQANDPFYELGTQILGYDVRTQAAAPLQPNLQAEFSHFDNTWTTIARPFGFHLTICDALDCDWATIPLVERELADLLPCFNPATEFLLQRDTQTPIGIWGQAGAHSLVLLYRPNTAFSMLHALLVGRINPLGKGSGYLQRYLTNPQTRQPHHAQQLRQFFSSTVLDNWYPHFTLLNPYPEADPDAMASQLARLSEPYTTLSVHSLCLLIQEHDEANWQIYREFYRI